ncbi:MAG: hypothetical protein ABI408_06225 [Gemmatimonadaceae bacterium]
MSSDRSEAFVQNKVLLTAFLLSTVSFAACGRRDNAATAAEKTPIPPVLNTPGPPKDTVAGDRHRVHWTLTGLEAALAQDSITLVKRGSVRQPFLGGAGVVYAIGTSELQVYLYADAGAVARDTDPLDTARVAPPTMRINWRLPPTLIVDNNIVLILLTRDKALRQRVKSAIEKSHGY